MTAKEELAGRLTALADEFGNTRFVTHQQFLDWGTRVAKAIREAAAALQERRP